MKTRTSSLWRWSSPIAFVVALAGSLSAQQVTRTPVEVSVPSAPVPARALGRTHLVYELHLTNFGTVPLLVHGLTTAAAGEPDNPIDIASPQDVARAAVYLG